MKQYTHIIILYCVIAIMIATSFRHNYEMSSTIIALQAHDKSDLVLSGNHEYMIKKLQDEVQYLSRSLKNIEIEYSTANGIHAHLKEEIHSAMEKIKTIEKRHNFFDTRGIPNRSIPKNCE